MANGISRAVIEVLLDRVSQGAGTLSPAGELTFANQRLASMLGLSRAELVGKPLAGLVAEPDREALAEALAAGREGSSQCRLALSRANGHGQFTALLHLAPLGHGQASCLVTDLSHDRQPGALAQEMRSMLGAMRSALEVLKHSGLEADDARRAVEAIERQTGRILEALSSRD